MQQPPEGWGESNDFHLSPNIRIQTFSTDLHTFPYRISWENVFKDQSIFPSVILFFLILINFSFSYVLILLEEIEVDHSRDLNGW